MERRQSRVTRQCQCGCTLTEQTGHIIASAHQRCQKSVRRWTIHVQPQYTISLTIINFTLSHLSSVLVYDSTTPTAAGTQLPLLVKLNKDADEDASRTLMTSGNRMLIKYVTVNNNVSAVRNNDGFIASYVATNQLTAEPNDSDVLEDTGRHERRYVVLTFWDSHVAIVGIGLCTCVIVASLSFVCYQRLALRRLRAKQDTQTPAYRALVAGKQKHADVGPMKPDSSSQSAGVTAVTGHRAAAVQLSTSSPVRQRDLTPSSARRHRDLSVRCSPLTATQLTVFQPRNDSPALRSTRTRCKSPREVIECACMAAGSAGVVDYDKVVLETRPPVEGRDSLSVEHLVDTATSVELKNACYVPPTECSVAVRRCLDTGNQPTHVTRGTSPMSSSDVDLLPDISGLLTSGTETDDVMTMTGAASSSSLSDLVAGCDAEFDSNDCSLRPHTTSAQQHVYKPAWTARRRNRNAMLEPDVYYC